MTVGCRPLSVPKEPFRASAGFQFVLLGLSTPRSHRPLLCAFASVKLLCCVLLRGWRGLLLQFRELIGFGFELSPYPIRK